VDFRIAYHAASRHTPPEGALELLWEALGPVREDVSFALGNREITANWRGDVSISMTQEERVQIGRRAVLDVVLRVCDAAPELDSEWFAVSPRL
jgi:hypothetical protein